MTTMTSEEHDSAVQRLHAKLLEQHRLDERYHDAIGTTTELGAYVRLRAAADEVAALERGSTGSTTRPTEGSMRDLSNCSPRAPTASRGRWSTRWLSHPTPLRLEAERRAAPRA